MLEPAYYNRHWRIEVKIQAVYRYKSGVTLEIFRRGELTLPTRVLKYGS